MRIAEISTLGRPVPPEGEGSVESLVAMLTEGLVARGHDVTLFATANSKTKARLRSPVATSYALDAEKWDWQLYEAFQVREAFRNWQEFDIIHCHSYYHGLQFCDFVSIPSLHSIHIEPGPDYRFLAQRTVNRHLLFASAYQTREFQEIERVHIIPHAIDLQDYPPSNNSRMGYLAFLGRFIPDKGALEAIAISKLSGMPLKLAAPHNEYYEHAIRPHVDGRNVEYLGELNTVEKQKFLSEASALVYPVLCGEPFGLVLVEAMACGTPVLAFAKGAVGEIVEHGHTGWLGQTVEDLADAAKNLDQFDHNRIRLHAERNYSKDVYVERVESLMARIVGERES